MITQTKTCKVCLENKMRSDFPRTGSKCNACRSEYYKSWRNKDPLVQWANNNKTSDRLAREKFLSGRSM